MFDRRTRRNVLTGEVPPQFTNSDFRNTYAVVGFCGIDVGTDDAVFFRIHNGSNDAESFSMDIEMAVACRFLKGGDVLVLDNASIHDKGENEGLADWLWHRFGIFVLMLPTRTPEWNPIELVWRLLVSRLKKYPMRRLRAYRQHAVAMAACEVLSGIMHSDVAVCYAQTNLIVLK